MKGRSAISKALNIKQGEGPSILLLMIFSFFLGIGIAFYYTATTSLLLVNFEREILPYAYIGGGAVVYLLSLVFGRLQKRIKASSLLVSAVVFLIISVAIFLLAYMLTGNKWITLVLFIWMRIFTYIQGISFWGLASRIFDLGQGKRLFGLISAGEVVSHIISFFSVPLLLRVINTEDLLFLSLAGLVLSMVFMIVIVKKFSGKLAVKGDGKKKNKPSPKKTKKLFNDKYFSLIFILAFIPMLANFMVDFVFLTQTKQIFSDKEVLSGFIGVFFGVTAIIEFIIKTFVSGRIINEHGIKVGLPSLPLLLGFSTLLAVIAGTILGPTGTFFSFVVLGKLFMRAIRTSLYDPSFQILFQPIPKDMRLAFQSKIEGSPKALGNIIAGGILLLFTSFSFFNVVHFNYLLLIFVALWLHFTLRMTKEYRNTLGKLVAGGVKIKKAIINDKSNINILTSGLHTSNIYLFKLLVRFLDKLAPAQKASILTYMLGNGSDMIKKTILNIIREKRIIKTRSYLEQEVKKDASAALIEDFENTIRILNETENISFHKIEELVKSDDPSERVSSAVLLGKSGRYKACQHILELSKDENLKVKDEAIIAAGYLRNYELWGVVIGNLASPAFATTAYAASKLIGPRILDDLDHFYNRMVDFKHVQLRIMKLYEEIGGDHAVKLLRSKIGSSNKEIRDKALDSLCKLEYSASSLEKQFIKRAIEEEIAATVYITASLVDLDGFNEDEDIISALRYELYIKREKLFNLLAVLYDPKTIQFIREVLAENSRESRVFALEIMDMMLSEDLKDTIMPLFDELPDVELINKYYLMFPQEKLAVDDRLCDICNIDYSRIGNWTRASAIRLLENYPSEKNERLLAANIIHPDRLIRDTAIRSLYAINIEKFKECVRRLKLESRVMLSQITGELLVNSKRQNMYMLDKIKLLSEIHFLSNISKPIMVKLAYDSVNINFNNNERICIDESNFMVILNGSVKLLSKNKLIRTLEAKDIIGEISPDYLRNPNVEFIADGQVVVLQICFDLLYELMIDHIDITEGLVLGLMNELADNSQQLKSEIYA